MKFYRKFLPFLALNSILSFSSWSQDLEYSFENLTSDEGYRLPVSGNLVQDQKGYIWFPTYDGLYRYDGYEFKKYAHKISDPNSLSFNTVTSLFADHDGTIWAGTFGGGLNHLDPVSGKCIRYKTSKTDSTTIGGDRISAIFRDSHKKLWLATEGAGLSLFNDQNKTFRRIRLGEPAASESSKQKCNHIFDILEDKDGDLFFTTWDGLFILDRETGQFSVHRCDTNYMRDRNNCMGTMFMDETGMLWISTWGGGIKGFDKKTGIFQTYLWNKKAGISHTSNICKEILSKSKDELWIAILDSKGFSPLAVFNKREKEFHFIKQSSLNPKSIPEEQGAGLFKDRDEHLWVTIGNKGVSMLDLKKQALPFEEMKLKSYPDIPLAAVTSCWKDTLGQRFFIGTTWSDGIYCLDLKTKKQEHIHDPFSTGDETGNIIYSKNNLVYISGDALKILDPLTKTISHFEPRPPAYISQMTEDRKGNLWGISYGNFLFYEAEKQAWKTIPVSTGKNNLGFNLHGIACYQDGTIWTGSDENGIFIIDPLTLKIKNIRKSTEKNGLPFNTVICFQADKMGRMWCGGIGGIAIYEPDGKEDRFRIVSGENGLANDYVNALAVDKDGFMWAFTLSAICKINPEKFSVVNYESFSGIFKKQHITGFSITSDNEIFAGAEMGFTHFYPEQFNKNLSPPVVVMNSFKIFDREYPLPLSGENEPVKLAYNENYFSFEFAALTFSDVSKNQYAYMLEGFDNDWIYAGTRRYAAYTNLPGGHYVFHVKAANKDDVWNEKGIAVPLFISTPWWKTVWFYVLVTLVICASGYAIYLYRIRQLKAIFAIRNKLAADLHDEVGSSLSNIRLLSEMLPSAASDGNGKYSELKIAEQIRESARGTLEGMYDIIWNLNPNNDHLVLLLSRLKEQTVPLAETKNILLNWKADQLDQSVKLSLEKRKDLYLSCKEAIQNALKYSECHDLTLVATTGNSQVNITITDNGKGFIPSTAGGGNGLLNMKQRMQRWSGSCYIESSGNGTTIRLSLPL